MSSKQRGVQKKHSCSLQSPNPKAAKWGGNKTHSLNTHSNLVLPGAGYGEKP